jgi:hypothetical protein
VRENVAKVPEHGEIHHQGWHNAMLVRGTKLFPTKILRQHFLDFSEQGPVFDTILPAAALQVPQHIRYRISAAFQQFLQKVGKRSHLDALKCLPHTPGWHKGSRAKVAQQTIALPAPQHVVRV